MSFGDVEDESIDSQMWTAYFHLGVAFLNQPALQVGFDQMLKMCKNVEIVEKIENVKYAFQVLIGPA